jgi:hypothetical protein
VQKIVHPCRLAYLDHYVLPKSDKPEFESHKIFDDPGGNLLVTLKGRPHLLRERFEFQPTCFGMRHPVQTKREHELSIVNEELQEVLCSRA